MNSAIFSLNRNDVESAIAFRIAGMAAGDWTRFDDITLMRLQDDPRELMDRIASIKKALPRMSDEQRAESNKKVGAKPIGAATKTLGSGGQVRYNYPSEKGGKGKPQPQGSGATEAKAAATGMPSEEQGQDLPHPELTPPAPQQEPIAAEHPPEKPADDERAQDPTQAQQPKHTINIGELCSATGVKRETFQQIATRIVKKFGDQARPKFIRLLQTQLKDFSEEHGLDGDYFGLLFDVLTGKVQDASAATEQAALAKK